MKVSQFIDESHDSSLSQQTKMSDNKMMEGKTSSSTDRTLEPEEDKFMNPVVIDNGKSKGGQLAKMEELLRSDRMFVNPDKWSEFMDKAMTDEQFHKSLNIFLYTYFITHYN